MSMRTLPAAVMAARPIGRTSVAAPSALDRWNPGVRHVAGDGQGENSISVLDVIGADWMGEGVTAKRIASALRQFQGQDVTVNINSPGGDYFEGLAIYNTLREHDGKVTTKILGIAASAASVIAMAGDEILIARAGFLMIHNCWVLAMGDRNELRDVADWLEPFDAMAVDIYQNQTGLKAPALASMLDKEAWIGGAAAVEQGFATGLLPADEVEDSPANRARGEGLRAERKLDNIAARADVPRSELRELLAALKALPGAGDADGMRGAAEPSSQTRDALASLRDTLRAS